VPPGVTLPKHLFHATSQKTARLIFKSGLLALSVGGEGDGVKYLCLSANYEGATTTDRSVRDVVFRVDTSKTPGNYWYPRGAGDEEWRSRFSVAASQLTWTNFGDTTENFRTDPKVLGFTGKK